MPVRGVGIVSGSEKKCHTTRVGYKCYDLCYCPVCRETRLLGAKRGMSGMMSSNEITNKLFTPNYMFRTKLMIIFHVNCFLLHMQAYTGNSSKKSISFGNGHTINQRSENLSVAC